MQQKHRVAFVGCGQRARAHAVGVLADPRLETVALVDALPQAAESFRTDHKLDAQIFSSHAEMLAQARPDIVVSCLWTPLHLPIYRDCARGGVRAVLCEKPMAPTWGECVEMARLEAETGCQLTFCHQRRFARGNIAARKIISEGKLGQIERLDLYSPPNLLDCGTHTFDQAISFLGESRARWVMGAVDTSSLLNWFGVRAEQMAIGTIVFENGVRASLQVGGPDADMGTGVRITGSRGFLEVTWDGEFRRGVLYDDPSWKPPTGQDSGEAHMIGLVRDAIDCLESGREPEASCARAMAASEIIFGLYESVRRRARVEIPLSGFEDSPLHAMLDATPKAQAN